MRPKDEAREAYYHYSKEASGISRQLGFAAIAIIWIFRLESTDGLAIPEQWRLPAFLVVFSLSLDFLQYVYGAVAWGVYHRWRELKDTRENEEFPRSINWPTNVLFYSKLAATMFAYGFILRNLAGLLQ